MGRIMNYKKALSLLFIFAVAAVLAAPAHASPGNITINGYTYASSASLYLDSYYSTSNLFPSGRKFTALFHNYAYRFTSGYSGTIMLAIEDAVSHAVIASPSNIGNNAPYDIYLNGTYIIHTFPTSSPPPGWGLQVSALSPGVISISSPYANAYLLKDSTHTLQAYITGSPTSVTASAIDGGGVTTSLGPLSYISGTKYERSQTFNQHFPVGAGSGVALPKLRITATFSTGTMYKEIPFYVTLQPQSWYQVSDSSWYYTSPYVNSFLGPANNSQMCYEYVIDIWSTPEPYQPDNHIIDFMLKQGPYSGRAGKVYHSYSYSAEPYPDAIYYTNFHFAKVVGWDSSGTPTDIRSKWGPQETIKTGSVSALTGYAGVPRIYFWD